MIAGGVGQRVLVVGLDGCAEQALGLAPLLDLLAEFGVDVFDLPPGISHTLYFKATFTDSGEGDEIMLRWSDDDVTYPLLMIYEVGDSGTVKSAPLPAELSGMVLIWMQDSDRRQGRNALDVKPHPARLGDRAGGR